MALPSALRSNDEREALFDGLYEAHRQSLHAYLLGRTSDAELALDLLQEAFVRAWRNLDAVTVLPEHRQRAWLFATGRNLYGVKGRPGRCHPPGGMPTPRPRHGHRRFTGFGRHRSGDLRG